MTQTPPSRDRVATRTIEPGPFADAVAKVILDNGLAERADVQSFDFRSLLHVQEKYPSLRTVYLLGDFPIFADGSEGSGVKHEYVLEEKGGHWRLHPLRRHAGSDHRARRLRARAGRPQGHLRGGIGRERSARTEAARGGPAPHRQSLRRRHASFPFNTIEDVVVFDRWNIGVINDNNYPFSAGRRAGKAEDTEFIRIELDQELGKL